MEEKLAAFEKFRGHPFREAQVRYLCNKGLEVRGGCIEELKVTEGSRHEEVHGAAVPRILTVRNTRYMHQMNPIVRPERSLAAEGGGE